MHNIDRTSVPRPVCLDGYDWTTQTWEDLEGPDKNVLRLALQTMQGRKSIDEREDNQQTDIHGLRCAYCESQIRHGGHIEHFRRKHPEHFPQLTFEWTNLFMACGSSEHCGHYKDRPKALPYKPDDLIKPDEHDPDGYLYFHSTGQVRVRHSKGILGTACLRAAETIRVFHLNCGLLVGARIKALNQYLDRNTGILEALMEFDENDRKRFIDEEVEATRWDPFCTTIRHFFEKLPA